VLVHLLVGSVENLIECLPVPPFTSANAESYFEVFEVTCAVPFFEPAVDTVNYVKADSNTQSGSSNAEGRVLHRHGLESTKHRRSA